MPQAINSASQTAIEVGFMACLSCRRGTTPGGHENKSHKQGEEDTQGEAKSIKWGREGLDMPGARWKRRTRAEEEGARPDAQIMREIPRHILLFGNLVNVFSARLGLLRS